MLPHFDTVSSFVIKAVNIYSVNFTVPGFELLLCVYTDHVEVRPKENFLGLILSFHLLSHLIDPALSCASFLLCL